MKVTNETDGHIVIPPGEGATVSADLKRNQAGKVVAIEFHDFTEVSQYNDG